MSEDQTFAAPPGGQPAGDLVTGEGLSGDEGAGDRPDAAQIRADLRARGHNPGTRGRLGADWIALWESGETAPAIGDGPPDPDGGVSAADFNPDHTAQVRAERPPGKPRAGKLRDRLGLGADTGTGKRKNGKEKTGRRTAPPKHERVPLDRIAESGFGLLARMTRVADPALSRTFALEAPLAGSVTDRALKGTLADRVLQPVARAQAKVNIIAALFGLPVGVVMLEQAQGLPDQARAIREGITLAMMRECAVMLAEFAAEDLIERAERNAAREGLYAQADQILQHILYGVPLGEPGMEQPADRWYPPDPGDQAAQAAQQAAAPGNYGGFMAPAPAGDPARPQYSHPYPAASPGAVLDLRP